MVEQRRGAALLPGIAAVLWPFGVPAADVEVVGGGPWITTVGVAQLESGAGSDFGSPVRTDELLSILAISNTGGGPWQLSVALDGSEVAWPSGISIAVRRAGGSSEAGLSDGLVYQALTTQWQPFFSGTGDYDTVEILIRIDGLSVQSQPGEYQMIVRYSLAAP